MTMLWLVSKEVVATSELINRNREELFELQEKNILGVNDLDILNVKKEISNQQVYLKMMRDEQRQTFKEYLQEQVDDEEFNLTDNVDEAIYKIDDMMISGDFDMGIRGLDHHSIKPDALEWEDIIDFGTLIIPETKEYVGDDSDYHLRELGFSPLDKSKNRYVGFDNGEESVDIAHLDTRDVLQELEESTLRKILEGNEKVLGFEATRDPEWIKISELRNTREYFSITEALSGEVDILKEQNIFNQTVSQIDFTEDHIMYLHETFGYEEPTRIFVDIDGVLAKFNNHLESFDILYQEGYFENLAPQQTMIDTVNELRSLDHSNIYILSSVLDSPYAIPEKLTWIEKHLPNFPRENIIFSEYGKSKTEFIPGQIGEKDILVDDYTKNLKEWVDAGGNGIKVLNGINNTNGTWNGNKISIHDLKLSESLQRSVQNIKDGKTFINESSHVDGTLNVKINYDSKNPNSITKQIKEIESALTKNGLVKNLAWSLSVDQEVIVDNQQLSADELKVASSIKETFLENDGKSFIKLAKIHLSDTSGFHEDLSVARKEQLLEHIEKSLDMTKEYIFCRIA
ncbi:deoxypyrimidine-specific 5' nucleotidase type C protein (NT5C) [Breznakia blatticola]|uniref:Deoxypyrimidine-specific 5' nucleotidase type C protein (NT5C) n=1 Tax=Breznakia blatticola TaxID=1754012 RepID=A0A4V3G7Q3_9FIRM|nr:hypothetical protein [Breznakia blatticola]TDW19954.1 deoxypyrimidine-specific 5' nucleotidase type C protein (NT5C) [Breznakia blatticola]